MTDAALPLAGLRVLDFSRVLAGPLCTQSLADLGADVIKVETPGTGDETRGWPPMRQPGFGAVFMAVNRNKRSIAVDLKTPEGQALVQRLAAQCDVCVENFSTGVSERLGIDEATLRRINPRLIYCTISGYGRDGPLKNAAGYDVILQAFSGMMSLTGESGGGNIRIPISPIDQTTGIHALTGILAALVRRGVSGLGGHVEVSLLDTAMSLLNTSLQSYWEKGVLPAKWGSLHEGLCPYQAFNSIDGPVMIGVANDGLWQKFCAAAGLTALGADPQYRTNADRVAHRPELAGIIQREVAKRPVADWVALLSQIGIPVAAINDLAQAEAHPQIVARELILDYDLGQAGRVKSVALPIKLDHRARRIERPPPRLGQHSWDVLGELGWESDEIAALHAAGVVTGEAV